MSLWDRLFKRRPASPPKAAMPRDWDDHEGWNRYFDAVGITGAPRRDSSDLAIFRGVYGTTQQLLAQDLDKIWLPGCGISVIPGLCAAMGLRVWASDVSESAIQIQQSWPSFMEWAPELIALQGIDEATRQQILHPGELHCCVHDFYTPFPEGEFDCIFNIKAFQGLPGEGQEKAARVFWEALKPGRDAWFSTMNVQGPRRTHMEAALIKAGFHVPYFTVNKWYRETLDSTGIDYVFILDRPRARGGGTAAWQAQQDRLQSFDEEYQQRIEQERPNMETILYDGVTKIAWVFYSTG